MFIWGFSMRLSSPRNLDRQHSAVSASMQNAQRLACALELHWPAMMQAASKQLHCSRAYSAHCNMTGSAT